MKIQIKIKDDLDLFMEIKNVYFLPYRRFHSMDANTFYISFPKPQLTRSQAGIIKDNNFKSYKI